MDPTTEGTEGLINAEATTLTVTTRKNFEAMGV